MRYPRTYQCIVNIFIFKKAQFPVLWKRVAGLEEGLRLTVRVYQHSWMTPQGRSDLSWRCVVFVVSIRDPRPLQSLSFAVTGFTSRIGIWQVSNWDNKLSLFFRFRIEMQQTCIVKSWNILSVTKATYFNRIQHMGKWDHIPLLKVHCDYIWSMTTWLVK